jgi:hypothetical protein
MLAQINSVARRLSLDTWAVIVALLAAVIVRAGLLKQVPW